MCHKLYWSILVNNPLTWYEPEMSKNPNLNLSIGIAWLIYSINEFLMIRLDIKVF